MSPDGEQREPSKIVEAERTAYIENLQEPDSDWPPDVRCVYQAIQDRLFDWRNVEAKTVVEDCGIRSHGIYGRFRYVVGYGIKEFIIRHRLRLAKHLHYHDSLSISEIAFAVGYASPSGFCTTFKRHEGCSPTEFRQQIE